ncbi:SDR family oxidoreductase [Kaistella sp. 97-N-M2]|uniref:SDR family oxidoreductase n=1 Tax=Kaistella sp. 97-N-M2 TaxID=2908645 RepID=UPI001F280E15|nr:SDR family oxidoreductase [Kaistella sp. 97-N-M2]UJF29253.1 SDR family oxidoreductase [Kaistella sp. 97-N-M2]
MNKIYKEDINNTNPVKVLVTGATGQVGGKTIDYLVQHKDIEIVAAVRSKEKAGQFTDRGIKTVLLDFDDTSTHLPAFEGIYSLFIVTGYTVDMLRQSKVLVDNAKKANIKHIVHLGACGPDDATVGHWVWHQLVERYIEWSGFSFTHLRPQDFMQNLLSYGNEKAVKNGVINGYVDDATLSWVDVENVAEVAALSLINPEKHNGKTYRLSYDALNFAEIAELMTSIVGQPFRYEALSPEIFLQKMKDAGAEMAYMNCVYDHWKQHANGTIPGSTDTFDNFFEITGKQPTRWSDFIQKHRAELRY